MAFLLLIFKIYDLYKYLHFILSITLRYNITIKKIIKLPIFKKKYTIYYFLTVTSSISKIFLIII